MTVQRLGILLFVVASMIAIPACGAIVGIFKAGVGVGIFLAILAIGLVFFVVTRTRG